MKAPTQRHLRLLPPPPQHLARRACAAVRLMHPVAWPELRLRPPVEEPKLSDQLPASIVPPQLVEALEPALVLRFGSRPAGW